MVRLESTVIFERHVFFGYLLSFIYLVLVFFFFSSTGGLTNEQSLSLVSQEMAFLRYNLQNIIMFFGFRFVKLSKKKK